MFYLNLDALKYFIILGKNIFLTVILIYLLCYSVMKGCNILYGSYSFKLTTKLKLINQMKLKLTTISKMTEIIYELNIGIFCKCYLNILEH